MKRESKIGAAIFIGLAWACLTQAALVGEWNFDNQTFVNTGSSGAIHDGTFVTTNANYFSTNTVSGSGYSLQIQSIADESDTTGGDVLLINNSSSTNAGYVATFDGTAFTVSMWVQSLDSSWTEWDEIAGKQIENYGGSPNDGWSVRSRTGSTMRFDSYGAGTAESTSDALDQTWHLITATYDGTTMNLYIDGLLEGMTTSEITDASLYALAFGARDDGSRGENMLIDEIQYYDETLSAAQVYALYNSEDTLFVDSNEIAMELLSPSTTITGSVVVSYAASTSVDVAVSITEESHPGAFNLLNTTPMVLTDPIPENTLLEFAFDNAVTGLLDGESATGLVTIAWNATGDSEVTEVVLPISVRYDVISNGPILWDFGKPSDGEDIPSTAADFVAAGVTEYIGDTEVSNVEGAQNMSDKGITVNLSNYAGTNIKPGSIYTGDGAAIMKEYVYHKGYCDITIGGLSAQLDANTEYSLYVWGKGDADDQQSIFSFDGVEITTATNDVFTSDATNFMAKFSFTTDVTVADTLTIGWNKVAPYTGCSGFAIVPLNYTNPNPEVGDVSMEVITGGTQVVLRFDTSFGPLYAVEATGNLQFGPWTNIAENISGTGSGVSITNALSGEAGFYRAFIQD